jgi:AcrR family transcriptional regulator
MTTDILETRMDPRIERSRNAVICAATQLLVEAGPNAVTMDGVVARSGVAKSTIYRHWSSRDDLLHDVFLHAKPEITEPDPELPFRRAIDDVVAQFVTVLNDPNWAELLPALLLLKLHEKNVASLEESIEEEQHGVLESVLRRGVTEGAIKPGYDIEEAATHLVGPLVFAQLTGRIEVDHGFAQKTLEVFLASYGTGA